ncbi:MAG: TrmH family RNA methyltransferase [Eubacteriales bacterium]
MEFISSRQNPLIIETSKLNQKKFRDSAGLFLFEGRKLFIEAKTAAIDIQYVFVTNNYYELYVNELLNYTVYVLSDGCFEKISCEKSPEGIICAAKHIDFLHFYIRIYNIHELFLNNKKLRLFLAAGIQDPGNLGTIIRTAYALGVDCLITDSECADLYNAKTIRASMGALFRQYIAISDDMINTVRYLKTIGYTVYSAAPDRSALRLDNLVISHQTCFLVGNEGHGLDDSLIAESSGCVVIPMEQDAESLNASIAAGILMWEGYKQRNN